MLMDSDQVVTPSAVGEEAKEPKGYRSRSLGIRAGDLVLSSNVYQQQEAVFEWLEQEMGYRCQHSSESLSKIFRGNMLPIWKFLLERVKSEKTVEKWRRNIHVHGNATPSIVGWMSPAEKNAAEGKEPSKTDGKGLNADENAYKSSERERRGSTNSKVKSHGGVVRAGKAKDGREREKNSERGSESSEWKESALLEKESAESDVARKRLVIERLFKDMKGIMSDLSTEEGERQRVLDEKSNSRHKQVLLEVYDQRCEQAMRILYEYWRRLHACVEHAREAQRGKTGWPEDSTHLRREPTLFATAVKGGHLPDDHIFIETAVERSIRTTCEFMSSNLIEKISGEFLAYDGDVAPRELQAEEAKIGFDVDGESVLEHVKETVLGLLRSPRQLLQSMVTYSAHQVAKISSETDRIDTRADAERLRYRYENNKVTEDVSPVKAGQQRSEGKSKADMTRKSIFKQLRERQTTHVHQFMATEETLNHAAELKVSSAELRKHMCGGGDLMDVAVSYDGQDHFQTARGMRELEVEVWTKEQDLAGLKASVDMLLLEVQRLKMMCEERKQAKDGLRKKWKKIEEFNTRRTELESFYTALIHTNITAAQSWKQQMVAARENYSNTFLPMCSILQNNLVEAADLIERELVAFQKSPDNRLYMFPASQQGILDIMGVSNTAGPEGIAAVHRNADLLVSRAGAGDPSALSSIGRISASLRNCSWEGADVGLAAVVESLQLFFRHKVSAANLLEDLAGAVRQMQGLKDLVGSGRMLLATANSSRPEYERSAASCLSMAAEHEKIALEHWLPELKSAVQEAQKCFENSKHVRRLVDEWWEQPASTAVDWITLDGQNVSAWLAHVKQLQAAFYDKELL